MTERLQTEQFAIDGMHCTSCGITIDWELEDLDGVGEARTSYADGVTRVLFDPQLVSRDEIVAAIKRAGFDARWAGAL
ncbi:MAG: heavy-metal-associated domain-containing protein [Anaerolineae bacterium]